MLATIRLCLFYSQATICLRTNLQWEVFPAVICTSLLRYLCKTSNGKVIQMWHQQRNLFSGWFLCFTWAQKKLHQEGPSSFPIKKAFIHYFWICHFSVFIHSPLQFWNSCPPLICQRQSSIFKSYQVLLWKACLNTAGYLYHFICVSLTSEFLCHIYSTPVSESNCPGAREDGWIWFWFCSALNK